jgi:enoyl-CoA hydratase/carnithine racemase
VTLPQFCEHAALYHLLDSGQTVDAAYARRLGFLRYLVATGRIVPAEDR